MRIAFGTDDGKTLAKKHCGASRYFKIYEILEKKAVFIETRENTSGSEKIHGDPNKAKKISEILKDVDVLIGYTFGPNLRRIKKKFLPIVSRYREIDENIEIIKRNLNLIREELRREEKRVIMIEIGPKFKII
ncbi:MAG: dinitrogenase iron-molybdenum cofactor biosynthesis protein [Thermoprotei archaeon]|nr:MAG: dinitrogenase iron-molybdenum cofactor biosynthesis protein [Thermoprotei archaeon]